MARVTYTNFTDKYTWLGASSATSTVVGYESATGSRVIRYEFTTDEYGATRLSFSKDQTYLHQPDIATAQDLMFYISASPDLYESLTTLDGGYTAEKTTYSYSESSTGYGYIFTGTADNLNLSPNTTYYLYFYPSNTNKYCCYMWNAASEMRIELDGTYGVADPDEGDDYPEENPYETLGELFTAIAESIRVKTKKTDEIKAYHFPIAISKISTSSTSAYTVNSEGVMSNNGAAFYADDDGILSLSQ